MVDVPLVLRLINPGVHIVMGEIRIFGLQRLDLFEFGSMCDLVDDGLEGLCHSGHGNHENWFKG